MIKVIVNGAGGRMGRSVTAGLKKQNQITVVAEGTRAQHQPDIVIDLTHADSVFKNTQIIIYFWH